MEDNDDDYFSDDGFESLPPATLLQLEQSAYHATQAQRPPSEEANRPQSVLPNPQADLSTRYDAPLRPPQLHTGITSEYGALDVGELDAEVLDHSAGQTPALGPPGFVDQLAHQQIHPDEGQSRPDPPMGQGDYPGDTQAEEPNVPQHIYEEFSLNMQKVINTLPGWNLKSNISARYGK